MGRLPEGNIKDFKSAYFVIAAAFFMLFITTLFYYIRISNKFNKELLHKIQIVEDNINTKAVAYKKILSDVVEIIEEKTLYKKRQKLFRLLGKNYKLLQDFNQIQEVLALRWIGTPPYNFHVDQLGIKPEAPFLPNPEGGSMDGGGIYSKIDHSSHNILDSESYQMCGRVFSKSKEIVGYLCINERLYDFLRPYEDDFIKINFVKTSEQEDSLLQTIFRVKVERSSQILLNTFKINGFTNHNKFIEQFVDGMLVPSFVLLLHAALNLGVLLLRQRKYSKIFASFRAQNVCHLSLHKFRDNLEKAQYTVINNSKCKLQFILENEHVPLRTITSTLESIHASLASLYNVSVSNLTIEEIEDELYDVLNIFNKTILNNKIKLKFNMESEPEIIVIDILTVQMILGSLLVESLMCVQLKGTIHLNINFFQEGKNIYMKIELSDNGVGKQMQKRDKIENAYMFPSIKEIKPVVEAHGSMSYENTFYDSKKINVKLLISTIQEKNNVVSIFKRTKKRKLRAFNNH